MPQTLVLDAGDALFSDHWLAQRSQGAVVIEAMNLMGYDAMALGERDLQLGPEQLRQRIAEANFPVLSANLELQGELFAQPYVIKQVGGRSVAIIGLTGLLPSPNSAFEVLDPLETARALVGDIQSQADIIVLLAHVGSETEPRLLEVEGVDVVVGGGGQVRNVSPVWRAATGALVVASEQPSSGHAGRFLGKTRLTFDPNGRITDYESQMVPMGPEVADDLEQLNLLQEYQSK